MGCDARSVLHGGGSDKLTGPAFRKTKSNRTMKTTCTLLLTTFAVGGIFSTAQAGPDLQTQEHRRNIAATQETRTVTAGQGGAVTFTWVSSPSGKGGTVVREERTSNIALFKSGKTRAKGSCDDAACCVKVR